MDVGSHHASAPARWQADHAGTSLSVADGMLFVCDPRGGLRIYEATSGRLIAVLPCGPGTIVADSRVALPEGNANSHRTTGVLDIWRLQ